MKKDIFHCSNCQHEMEAIEELINNKWEVTELHCENCGESEKL